MSSVARLQQESKAPAKVPSQPEPEKKEEKPAEPTKPDESAGFGLFSQAAANSFSFADVAANTGNAFVKKGKMGTQIKLLSLDVVYTI